MAKSSGWSGDQESWREVMKYLPGNYDELAVEHRQLLLQYGNAKIRSADQLLRFIFLHVGADLPLRQTVAMIAEAGGPNLSAMRLHKKMAKAGPYLDALMMELTKESCSTLEDWGGYDPVSIDASAICGPGATTTDSRIHAVVRLTDLSVADVRVTDVSGGETYKRFVWRPGQLVIGDRGYAHGPGIGWVVEHDADVLVRVNRGSLPIYDENRNRIDVLDYARKLSVNRVGDWRVQVHDGQRREYIEGRLLVTRLPKAEALKAQRRLEAELGNKATAAALEASRYVILFTTAPAERLSARLGLDAYRVRWQVELQFKRWKSLCGFDRLPNIRTDTIVSWVRAKVLLGLLLERMAEDASQPRPEGATSDAPVVHEESPSSPRKKRREPARHERFPTPNVMTRRPWLATSLLWPAMVAALIPQQLPELVTGLPSIVARVEAMDRAGPDLSPDDKSRPQQVRRFRQLAPSLGKAGAPALLTREAASC